MSQQDAEGEGGGIKVPLEPEMKAPNAPGYLAGGDARLRHRLRTPLNHIIGYSELLMDTVQERGLEELLGDLRYIHCAGKDLLAALDEVFDPVAVEAGGAGEAIKGGAGLGAEDIPVSGGVPEAGSTDLARGARLLVVDDNSSNRDMVRRLLESEGHEVLEAGNGREALELLGEKGVDLILLDVMMPVMDGIAACRSLKDDPETRLTPVIMMTALSQVEDRVQAIRAGADDFLTKPVHREELVARVETSLRMKQTVDTKLERLLGRQEYLARFVPQSVIRQLEQNPDAPAIEKSDQDLSAMFVDVTGYGKLSEEMRQTADFMIEKYFSRFLDAIHAQQGDVTETSGDGLMVVFPGEDTEEHSISAVKAALEILRTTEEMNSQLQGILDPLAVHIGINSGIALIGPTKYEGTTGARWTYTALGPAVNLAARIAGVATGGMVCVGPETAKRIEGVFAVESLGPKRLKNVKDEVEIHRVIT